MQWINANLKGDKYIWLISLVLLMVSLLVVYSSTGTLAYQSKSGNTEFFLVKQSFFILSAFTLTFIFHRFNFRYFKSLSLLMLALSLMLLVLTIAVGTNINNASRWLTIPIIGMPFQTSDFAKLSLMIFLADHFSRKQKVITDFKKVVIPFSIAVGLICVLILPSNFSTAALLVLTSCVIAFIARVRIKHLFLVGLMAIGALVLFLAIGQLFPNSSLYDRVTTWEKRIMAFGDKSDETANYQVNQAKIAIASGGVFGKGPGRSTQRNYLPESYSDFIYAIMIEEYGMIGCMLPIFLYMGLLFRCSIIVKESPRAFGALVAIGLSFSMVIQALVNMFVAVNILPTTGQTLPFLSLGGTSLWFSGISIGIILNISSIIEEEQNKGNLEPES